MESTAAFRPRASRLLIYLVALTVFGILLSSGAAGYPPTDWMPSAAVLTRSTNGNSRIDPTTGYPSGSVEDQQIRAFLKESGYEGGATVVQFVDSITGYPIGSSEDQLIRTLLKQSGYEGGGTVARGGAPDG